MTDLPALTDAIGRSLTGLRIYRRRQQPETLDLAIAYLEEAERLAISMHEKERRQ